jgi:protein SCO1/2
MKKRLLLGATIVPLLALAAWFALRRPPAPEQGFRGGSFDPPREAPAFSLDGSHGNKLSLGGQLGRVVILQFGYSFCQEVCPVTLAHLTQVFKKLGGEADGVQLIFITVDPGRDTPSRLREYLAAFNPTFLGATGTPAQIDAVHKAYGVVARQVVSPNPALRYSVDHSSSIYLIDRQGRLRGLETFGTPADDILHDVRILLESSL